MKNDDRRWYVSWDSHRFGPYSQMELIDRVRNGNVDISAYIFCEGMESWEPITTYPLFSAAFSFIPPAPTELEPSQIRAQVEISEKFETPQNIKILEHHKTYRHFSFIRFLFVVLFVVAGYTGAMFLYESRLFVIGNSDDNGLFGIIVGFILSIILFRPFKKRLRRGSTDSEVDSVGSKRHFSFSMFLGFLISIGGLIGTYIAYDPDQWQAVVVYPNGKEDLHPARFKNKQECYTWTTTQLSMMANTMQNNPNMTYLGVHTYTCRRFCYDKFDCTLKGLKNRL